jgi:FtsH-binding integral membrane protein
VGKNMRIFSICAILLFPVFIIVLGKNKNKIKKKTRLAIIVAYIDIMGISASLYISMLTDRSKLPLVSYLPATGIILAISWLVIFPFVIWVNKEK